ncbi:polysaccharide pyruvyl transferase family protein [Planctomycetales bacterium ZRK34]|nr:polysaccharide pyruvyl transferase family protein [Planctomycetales bacterium ZRK34]
MSSRRSFVQAAAVSAAGVSPLVGALRQALGAKPNPTIILRSGWQTVNIGDITHTPGVLNVLRKHLPDVHVLAWLSHDDRGVGEMLRKEFPKYEFTTDRKLVGGEWFKRADFMLHGSGPSVVAARDLRSWRDKTGKPFGTFGVTIGSVNDWLRTLLNEASFVYTRETKTHDVLAKAGVTKPVIGFMPDGTFDFQILNEDKGLAYLKANGLEDRKFICAIPRLRYTPYHKIKKGINWSDERIRMVETTNEKYGEQDHAKMREAMIRWVRETGLKILVCPEMTYQIDVMDELLIDPLPADVKKNVVKRDTYWLPDEAASVYKRAHTVVSAECHSPIIAEANGTPAFYVRQPTDTIKGQMYYDLGLADWTFEVDDVTGKDIADQLMKVYSDYTGAQKKRAEAIAMANARFDEACATLGKSLG